MNRNYVQKKSKAANGVASSGVIKLLEFGMGGDYITSGYTVKILNATQITVKNSDLTYFIFFLK